jgi:hypothetical protein
MSELDVIVIHIRAEQAAEYERLFAERELPRWREYKERVPSSAPGSSAPPSAPTGVTISPSTSSPSRFPVTPSTASTTPIPDSRSSTGSPTRSSRRIRWCTADRCCTRSDRHSALASAPGFHAAGGANLPPGSGLVADARPELEPTGTAQSGPGGQALGLVTERDESMKCLSVTAPPERRLGAVPGQWLPGLASCTDQFCLSRRITALDAQADRLAGRLGPNRPACYACADGCCLLQGAGGWRPEEHVLPPVGAASCAPVAADRRAPGYRQLAASCRSDVIAAA